MINLTYFGSFSLLPARLRIGIVDLQTGHDMVSHSSLAAIDILLCESVVNDDGSVAVESDVVAIDDIFAMAKLRFYSRRYVS